MKFEKQIEDMFVLLHKKFGEGSITRLTARRVEAVPVIESGSMSLDRALGVGGYPRGRIIEIYGPEASGKTTLALHAIASVQESGGVAAFVDAEHALDLQYATALGVKTDDLLFSQPDYGEQALEIVETLTSSALVELVVVDSVAALTPKAEIDGEMGDQHLGLHARLMSQAMRKLVATAFKNNVTVIFINQLRQKIGVMFGSPEVTTGGNALKFYSSVRIDVRRRQQIQGSDSPVGNQTHIKVVKNKLAPPFQEADIDLIWGKGIDKIGDIVGLGVQTGVITKAGSWLSYGNERLGQGGNNSAKRLLEDVALLAAITGEIRAKIMSKK